MKFTVATSQKLRLQIINLLQEQQLPVSDLDESKELFALLNDSGELIATGGLEYFGDLALLRSVAVQKDQQGKGCGKQISTELENIAAQKGIKAIYLLTTTAKDFFEKQGYLVVDRQDVPEPVNQSSEFSSVCPSSATVMKKILLTDHPTKKKLLFVCIENSNRSQMSQAFAKMLGDDKVEAYSAGSKPSGIVNSKAIEAMKELGYDLSRHNSKSLEEVKQFAPFDVVVTMGCGDACPWMPAKQFIDWQIPDPKEMDPVEFNKVRDFIKGKVKELIARL